MVVTVLRKSRREVDAGRLQARALRLLELLKLPPHSELNVLLLSDDALKSLHRKHFGLNTRTNVISFGQWKGGFSEIRSLAAGRLRGVPIPLGDIAISVDRARAEAEAAGIALDSRLTQLVIHGLLHILGHEHERGGPKASAMRKAESRLFEAVHGGRPGVRNPNGGNA
ncbi:MAG: rRNA maturation RNase YbeY [Nitrospirae bacterium]|nr:rRNA maturation RNase YbeY [Nitrospirota bacterium]